MSSTKRRGGRRLKVVFASAIAAFAAGAVGVSAASAATITLDHGFLKISGLDDPTEVITPSSAVNLDTGVTPLSGFTVDDNPDINDIQTITGNAAVTGGTYTITVDGQTTGDIAFNAPLFDGSGAVSSIADHLGALSNLTYFDTRLTGGPLPGNAVTLEFVGADQYGTDVPDIVVDSTNLMDGTYGRADVQDGSDKSDFDFPQFEGDLQGIPLGVDVSPLAPVTGTFNNGTMTTSATTYNSLVALGPPLNATCNYQVTLAFSTADNPVFMGDLFDAGTPTNGAITDDWTGLPAQGGACALVDGFTSGPGALWLSNGVATPTLTPKPPATPTPPPATKKKCKKGQKLVKGKCKKKKKKKKKK